MEEILYVLNDILDIFPQSIKMVILGIFALILLMGMIKVIKIVKDITPFL